MDVTGNLLAGVLRAAVGLELNEVAVESCVEVHGLEVEVEVRCSYTRSVHARQQALASLLCTGPPTGPRAGGLFTLCATRYSCGGR